MHILNVFIHATFNMAFWGCIRKISTYYSMLGYGRCDGRRIAKWLMWLAVISDWLAGELDGWRFVSSTLTVFAY